MNSVEAKSANLFIYYYTNQHLVNSAVLLIHQSDISLLSFRVSSRAHHIPASYLKFKSTQTFNTPVQTYVVKFTSQHRYTDTQITRPIHQCIYTPINQYIYLPIHPILVINILTVWYIIQVDTQLHINADRQVHLYIDTP